MAVRDEKSGEYRQDVKVLHVKILDPSRADQQATEEVYTTIADALAKRGLEKEYIVLVTGPNISISIDMVENLIKALSNDKKALTDVQQIDSLIDGLKKAREARWKKQERQKEQWPPQ